ncbi:ABC transporter permease [Jeotgalibacillus proteolyticus]|uniref:ABC transporter n=1 Tax=Jeotgalibacillus proteolyticus TaxID=2082395 RepID=A0A2S5GCN7_9BACL|nr:ABC transporter permease [Jeotgalibacillus proteolyticus]PPA70759.1 ABC transporter [Jeotgalibacillus proteolyticus]
MNYTIRRTMAIFQKDYKDMMKNLYVSTTIVLPLIMAAFYGRTGVDTVDGYFLVFNMTFSVVAAYIQASLIAEEKEKNTLRGLMLSPASTGEIMAGKSLLSFVSTVIILFISAIFMRFQPADPAIIVTALVISTFFYIALGTLLGLVTRSVMEASVAILPVLLFFSFAPFATVFMDEYPILKIAEYLPNLQLVELGAAVEAGGGFEDVWSNLLILISWTAALLVAVVVMYQKKMIDK